LLQDKELAVILDERASHGGEDTRGAEKRGEKGEADGSARPHDDAAAAPAVAPGGAPPSAAAAQWPARARAHARGTPIMQTCAIAWSGQFFGTEGGAGSDAEEEVEEGAVDGDDDDAAAAARGEAATFSKRQRHTRLYVGTACELEGVAMALAMAWRGGVRRRWRRLACR
jgi:hypothetical protein